MNKLEIKEFLRNKPGYVKFGGYKLSTILDSDKDICQEALQEVRREFKNKPGKGNKTFKITLEKDYFKSSQDVFKNAFVTVETKQDKRFLNLVNYSKKQSNKNVLIIGDLHEPFCLDNYLGHCIETYNKYKCNEVVFIGDIIDNHASSYHETDPDGHSAGQELKMAIQRIKQWNAAFPKATVIIGNHDRLIMRKAYSSGLSKMWIKDYAEVLGTPGWNFTESIEIDDVLYIHGEGGTARARVRRDLQSVVQGHLHSQAYIDWVVGAKFKLFGMQVGCGVDHKSYAMAYGKEGPKPAIACGVVLNGEIPINIMMNL
jgi:UDP-2,3-diacylglucosamine pyrophosphatase LpxH